MPESHSYYAHIDKVEGDAEEIYFEFHCLEEAIAIGLLNLETRKFHEELLDTPVDVITLQYALNLVNKIFRSDNITDTESQWVKLNTNTNEEGLEATMFQENGEEIRLFIWAIIPFEENDLIQSLLNQKVSLNDYEDATRSNVKALLESNQAFNPEFIAVYNVGQGNCNAFCNQLGQPLLYFDLGGGCCKNKHTYPQVIDFCFSKAPPILLSHWDMDHFESAVRNTSYKKEAWIVPRQIIGPFHLKFYLSISGTKLIWPSTLTSLSFPWGEIVVCKGPPGKKNHTGLAVLADIKPGINKIKEVMMPADAAYAYIPGSTPRVFDAIIATHHGAEFDRSNSPVSLPSGIKRKYANAFSYGSGNTYSHPRMPAVNAHVAVGWKVTDRRNTDAGHIAIADCSVAPIACGGQACSLQTVQKF